VVISLMLFVVTLPEVRSPLLPGKLLVVVRYFDVSFPFVICLSAGMIVYTIIFPVSLLSMNSYVHLS